MSSCLHFFLCLWARRSAECFVQVVNLLNCDYPDGAGPALCEAVLATLTALLAGNEASRRRLIADVGYDQILTALARQVLGAPLAWTGNWCHSARGSHVTQHPSNSSGHPVGSARATSM